MKFKFTDNSVAEFATGGFYAKNDNGDLIDADGAPIDVDPAMANDLLKLKHVVNGEESPMFEIAKDEEPEAAPADENTVEFLVKKHNRAELVQMAKDAGLDGDSYTNKSELAEAILNSQKEN